VILKHLRALDALMEKKHHAALVKMSRALAPLRELDVVLSLAVRFGKAPGHQRFLSDLKRRRSEAAAALKFPSLRALGTAGPSGHLDPAEADLKLKKLKRRVKRVRQVCAEGGSAFDFHEWRKKLKQLQFASQAMGVGLGVKPGKRALRVAALLGDAHDLDRLCELWVATGGRSCRELARLRKEADCLRLRGLRLRALDLKAE